MTFLVTRNTLNDVASLHSRGLVFSPQISCSQAWLAEPWVEEEQVTNWVSLMVAVNTLLGLTVLAERAERLHGDSGKPKLALHLPSTRSAAHSSRF